MNNTRILFVVFFVFVFFSALLIRLFNIQIKNHDDLDYFAKRQQVEIRAIRAERGKIFDRNGELLAYDRNDISFFVDKRMLNEERMQIIAAKFSKVFGQEEKYYLSRMKGDSIVFCLQRKAQREQALQLKDFVIDGLFSKEDPTRIYSYKNIGSHVLGYVGDNYSGVDGIEKYYNEELTGKDGRMLVERDVRGRMITVAEESTIKPAAGKNIYLTIDLSYQKILQDELAKGVEKYKGQSGTGIIMNPSNGEILALSNFPDFDPNLYWTYPDDSRRNRCLTDTYEPGSTFKSVSISTLIDKNLCNPDEVINTENGLYRFMGRKIEDSHRHPYLTVKGIIEQSSNIGMAKLIPRIDSDSFYEYLRNYGFGNLTSIDLPGENKGRLKKPPAFSKYTMPSMAYGYEVSVTPIQLISAYSAIINGGNLYQPHLLKYISEKKEQENISAGFIRKVIDQRTSSILKNFMKGVVDNGTAQAIHSDKISIGGKTGTSKLLINGRYTSKYNSSFAGFFPVEDPKVLCLIVINSPEVGGYGALVAAPIFKNVTDRLLSIDASLIPAAPKTENSLENVFTSVSVPAERKYANPSNTNTDEPVKKNFKLNKNVMPDLTNHNLRDALTILSQLGLKYRVIGNGKVIGQSIKAGSSIRGNSVCFLNCEERKISRLKIN